MDINALKTTARFAATIEVVKMLQPFKKHKMRVAQIPGFFTVTPVITELRQSGEA